MIKTLITSFESKHNAEIVRIRRDVFTIEQKIVEEDIDIYDSDAMHVLIEMNGQFVGTGRMLADGHIGRLAVLKSARGLGMGKELVFALIKEAKTMGLRRVYLGSQKQAVGFYQNIGFSEYGKPYLEAGILHVYMEKSI